MPLLAGCLLLGACGSAMRVYKVNESTTFRLGGGVMYALPRTHLQVTLAVTHSDTHAAPFHAFAHECLGVDTLPQPYALERIGIAPVATADKREVFYVLPARNSLYLAPNGLLLGVNHAPAEDSLSPMAAGPAMQYWHDDTPRRQYLALDNTYERVDTFYTRLDAPGHPSLPVAKTDTRSLRQQAQEAASRLASIDEKQRQLLFGEYEGDYAGESVQYLYERLEQMKGPLLALFLPRLRRETFTFYYDPSEARSLVDSQQVTLCYFSPTAGITDSASQTPDSRPVTCTVTCDNAMRRAVRFAATRGRAKRGAREDRRSLKYRVPQGATVTITCPGYAPVAQYVPVMQFGAVAALPSQRAQASFDPRTGSLLQAKSKQ